MRPELDVGDDRLAMRIAASVVDTIILTDRHLRRLVRVPTLLAFSTIQPILFVLLFTFVFSGAIDPPGVEGYIDYLLPGLVVLSLAFGASQTGVAMAADLTDGMIDRFRSLPMTGVAVLAGRTLADAARNLFVVLLMAGVGTAVGFRFHGDSMAAVAAVLLALVIGVGFSWVNAVVGLLVKDAETANLAGVFIAVVLVFTSSTFVPVATMPDWLQTFAGANPITVTVDALRSLSLGLDSTRAVVDALVWIGVLLGVSVPVGAVRYRRVNP
ncbi:MAG TPA: ABC transporter permease [Acidimicrobiia bacterium]|nr:ABC transporter permease [Acidimicrobiia bacterium]